jgi:hypothetical protein
MQTTETLSLVRKLYAAVLADAMRHYARAGIVEEVEATKRKEQLAAGRAMAAQLDVTAPEEAFTRTAAVFDCADWRTSPEADGFRAEASRCALCALAKRLGAPSPCRIYCLNPIEGMIRALAPDAGFEVSRTIFEAGRCCVRVKVR